MDVTREYTPHFVKVVEHLVRELSTIRTGRATPALVEDMAIEAYGTTQPLKALASLSTPDSRTLAIEPWDASVVKAIETAIQKSDIGIQPVVDGKMLRLVMPTMTEETRLRMVKVMKEKLEEAKVSIRKVREEARKAIEKIDGIGKDDIHAMHESVEKTVKEFMTKVDEAGEKKEKEITSI